MSDSGSDPTEPGPGRAAGCLGASLLGLASIVVLLLTPIYGFSCGLASADSGGDRCGVAVPVLFGAAILLGALSVLLAVRSIRRSRSG
jgi:hypothetical protein